MKKLLVLLSLVVLVAITAVLADTIVRPPTVQWTPVTTYSDGQSIPTNLVVKYNVYRSTLVNTNWVKVTTTTNLTYADVTAVLGETYRYQIGAELFGIEATPSPAVSFRAFAPSVVGIPSMQQ